MLWTIDLVQYSVAYVMKPLMAFTLYSRYVLNKVKYLGSLIEISGAIPQLINIEEIALLASFSLTIYRYFNSPKMHDDDNVEIDVFC